MAKKKHKHSSPVTQNKKNIHAMLMGKNSTASATNGDDSDEIDTLATDQAASDQKDVTQAAETEHDKGLSVIKNKFSKIKDVMLPKSAPGQDQTQNQAKNKKTGATKNFFSKAGSQIWNISKFLYLFFWGKTDGQLGKNKDHQQQAAKSKQTKIIEPTPKKTVKKNKSNFHQKHPIFIKILKIIFFPIINPFARYAIILLILAGIGTIFFILKDLPSPRRLTSKENYAVSTQIFDRNGKLLYEIFGEENRIPISIDDLPPYVYQASISIEDKNFYKHFGFDIEGIARAIRTNLKGERLEGGSTITQQLVKYALLSPERSIQRKIKEAILAMFTELIYSKEEILEMYLNYISYGGTNLGIESAANRYFGKHAKDLTLAESALLAGLPQAPTKYSPFGSNPKQAKDRQAEVLRRMSEDQYITALEAENAKNEVLQYALSQTEIKAPHFVFYVRDLLYEQYGEEKVQKGGLRVTTTLDLDIQNAAQASLSAEIEKIEKRYRVSNGAAIITKPNTGEILAMIGSRDYFDATNEGQVNVTLAERQPGSSIKPVMYSIAFQNKVLNPGTVMLDVPTCFKVPGQKDYCPKNYTGKFSGPVTIRRSMGNSLNIPAVKSLKTIGLVPFIAQARQLGITTWINPSNYGLSLTLGGGEVKMIDMAQVFGVLANQGVKVPLTPILEITDYQGNVIESTNVEQRIADLDYLNNYVSDGQKGDLVRVMDRAPAYMTSHIMQDNNARIEAFGPNSDLVIKDQVVSAKTGTTNNMKDNWTVGFTPEFLTIVWVGNNDGAPMSQIASGVTGASPIWHAIMAMMLKGREPIWQEKPPDVLSGGVCANGMPPEYSKTGKETKCQVRYNELYWKESKPSASRYIKQQVWINPATGQPPNPGEQIDGLVLQEKMVYVDPSDSTFCEDCLQATDEQGSVVYQSYVIDEQNEAENQPAQD